MGKDSLLKSTSKKNTSTKKNPAKKQVVKAKAAKTKASKQTNTTKKDKKTTSLIATKKTTPAGKTAASKTVSTKKRSSENIILRKFKPWKPQRLFHSVPDKTYLENFVAPPLIPPDDTAEAERLKKILFRKFDLSGSSENGAEHFPSPAESVQKESIDTLPQAYAKRLDPMTKMLTYLAAGLVFIVALIIAASTSNHANYYITATDGAVEIWRGRFAPMGEERILLLPGAQMPKSVKAVYTENEIKDFAFRYYLDKADTLLEASGMPDFEGIRLFLNTALLYGQTPELRRAAADRMNTIDMMTYLYKADVAASKGTLTGYQTALGFLGKAAALDLDEAQLELIRKKIKSVEELIVSLQAKSAGKPETLQKPSDQTGKKPDPTAAPAR